VFGSPPNREPAQPDQRAGNEGSLRGPCQSARNRSRPADYAELIDAHLLPAIEKLLNASSGTADQLQDALNELASAYADTLYR